MHKSSANLGRCMCKVADCIAVDGKCQRGLCLSFVDRGVGSRIDYDLWPLSRQDEFNGSAISDVELSPVYGQQVDVLWLSLDQCLPKLAICPGN
jgi:hypothetical protein